MRLTNRGIQRNRRIELAMTSMIDMTFLLLVFFMTTGGFMTIERNLDSAIKDRPSGRTAASDLEPAIVEIVRSGERFVYRVGSRELTSVAELTALLRQFPNKVDGAYVRVSDGAPFRMAAGAIQACKNARFLAVAYVPAD
jgi:biopolymer transport protein ExbD